MWVFPDSETLGLDESITSYCQAQFQLASRAKPSWVSTIITLHNHPTTGKVSKHHLQSSQEAEIWQTTLFLTHLTIRETNKWFLTPLIPKNNNNLFDQPNTAQLNLSLAKHSSAPACLLLFYLYRLNHEHLKAL